jgi:tetratricopeptide (TPR) repeat protein
VSTHPATERIYGLHEVVRILGIAPKRLAQLKRLDLLLNDSGYTFRDLLALRAASALLDAGASVRQLRQAMRSLRQLDRSLTSPLVELRLIVDGHRLLAQSDRVRFDPRSGQMVLDLDTGRIEEAAAATLTTGLVRPMSPPAEQAEAWFARASDWEADPAQWEDAIDAYRRVVALDPSYAAAWNNLGLLVHRMGRHEEARHAYAQAVAADPRLCEASYNLGALAEDLGDLTQAIAHYRAALRLAPDYADAHFNLAGALVRAGRPDEATPHWQRYLQLDAGSPWSRIARAHLARPE